MNISSTHYPDDHFKVGVGPGPVLPPSGQSPFRIASLFGGIPTKI